MEHKVESANGRVADRGSFDDYNRSGTKVRGMRGTSRTRRRRSRRKSSGWAWWEREVAKRHSNRTIQRHPTVTNAWRPYLTWCYRTFPCVTLTDRPRSRRTSIFGHFASSRLILLVGRASGYRDIRSGKWRIWGGYFSLLLFFLKIFLKIIKRLRKRKHKIRSIRLYQKCKYVILLMSERWRFMDILNFSY